MRYVDATMQADCVPENVHHAQNEIQHTYQPQNVNVNVQQLKPINITVY